MVLKLSAQLKNVEIICMFGEEGAGALNVEIHVQRSARKVQERCTFRERFFPATWGENDRPTGSQISGGQKSETRFDDHTVIAWRNPYRTP